MDNNAIIEIEPVGIGIPAVRLGGSVAPILEALNPLGVIGKDITEILVYKAQSERLEIERERIKAQAKGSVKYFSHI